MVCGSGSENSADALFSSAAHVIYEKLAKGIFEQIGWE
jgi:hypothetical protein